MPGGIHPPLNVIIEWPRPNFSHPETRPNTAIVLACILGPITLAALSARFWTRMIYQKYSGWDDWVMLAATIPILALTVLYPLAVQQGFNKHIWDINPLVESDSIVKLRKLTLAAECLFCVASGMIKISILFSYRLVSARSVSTTFVRIIWLSVGFIAAYTIALTLAPILGCQPISAFWDQLNAAKLLRGYEYHCFDEGADFFSASIISVAQDLLTAILLTILYWNILGSTGQNFASIFTFAIGYIGVVVGAIRVYLSWRIFYQTYDVTWSTWDLMIASILELHIGAFCANAPAVHAFFKHCSRRLASSRILEIQPMDPHMGRYSKDSQAIQGAKIFPSKFHPPPTKSKFSHAKGGFFQNSKNYILVHAHGAVISQIKRASRHTHSGRPTTHHPHASISTTNTTYHPYHEDAELGSYTSHSSWNSRSSLLPTMPASALSLAEGRATFVHTTPPHSPSRMREFLRHSSSDETELRRIEEGGWQQRRPKSPVHAPWPEWQL